MKSALQEAITAMQQKTKTAIQNAAMKPVEYIQNKWGKTTINEQNPGGLISPVPQEMGKTYNTDVPVAKWLQSKIIGLPQPSQQEAKIKPEKWWDSTENGRYKQFDNREEYQQAVDFFNKARGISPTPTPIPQMAQPNNQMQNKVLNQNNTLPMKVRGGVPKINQRVQEFLEQRVFPITREYGIPDAVAAGQFAAEGRFDGLGADRNNFYNINAVDHNPNLAHSYETPEEGIRSYADLISRRYGEAIQQQELDKVLAMIEQLGYAGDPRTYQKRAQNGYQSYSDFIKNTPEYRFYSQQ